MGLAGRKMQLSSMLSTSDCKNQEIYSLEKKKKNLPSQALCEVVGKKERRYQEELWSPVEASESIKTAPF